MSAAVEASSRSLADASLPRRIGTFLRRAGRAAGRSVGRPISFRLTVALGFLVLGVILTCAAVWYSLAGQNDEISERHVRAHLLGTIEDFRLVLGDAAARYARPIAAGYANGAPSALEGDLVPTGRRRYRHRAAYLVGGRGEVIAAYPEFETAMPPEVVSLVASVRADQRVGRYASAEGPRFDEGLAVETDIVVLGEEPVVVAVAPIRQAQADGAPVLVTLTLLDEAIIKSFAQASGAHGLRFETDPSRHHGQLQSQLDRRGRIVGWFTWDAQRPMMEALTEMWPLQALAGTGFLGFAVLSMYQLGRTERGLRASTVYAQKIAHEDPLTGLPNRRKTLELLDAALAARAVDQVVAFGFLDLDGFKDVNALVGHEGGDYLLAAVAGRLQAALPAAAILGRIGGDEFALIMTVEDPSVAIDAASAAIRALSRPFWTADQAVQIGASIGMSEAPRDGATRGELIRLADLALRSAKQRGRGRVVGFDRGIEQEMSEHRFIKRELPRAMADNALDVHYQPIVAGDGLRIVGVEALLRWTHPSRGNIPPAVFVPVAEQSGMMGQLGRFVLRRALLDAKRWPELFVAVNLSPVQVRDRGLVDLVAATIAESGIAASRVVLEITEGVLIENPEEAKQRLKQLRELGVKIALDDFGSGYSSLSYLRRLPIDKLKIDREFVAPLGRSANGAVIVQAIIALGRALGLSVLAEGVETEEQRILLRLAGCDEMQGFLFAHPVRRHEIDAAVARASATPQAPETRHRVAMS